jgi:two-component system C4-dicarboxylate transport sensor histidine kinase DctB
MTRGSRTLWLLGLAGVLLALAAGWLSSGYATRIFLNQTAQRAESTLRLTVAGLSGALRRYEALPDLIADSENIRTFMSSPGNTTLEAFVNTELKKINTVVQSSDIYIMRPDGLTIAASNFDSPNSFIGNNFSYRPYFKDAFAGHRGRYFALGTTSQKRGYYFAAPVRRSDDVIGVVALKMNVEDIEAAWHGAEHEIIVVDADGIIFMSGRPEWRFAAIQPLSAEARERISQTRKYPDSRPADLNLVHEPAEQGPHQLATIKAGGSTTQYLVKSAAMPEADWTVLVLSNTASAITQAYTSLALVILLVLTMLLALAFMVQRRRQLMERIAAQRTAQAELEHRVAERTADLNSANAKLIGEIAERKQAEQELHKTQADLIQASKLAALGQMSAALSHEFNQPLSAAKSYADNAVAYIDRDRTAEARENISHISSLVDRMAAIGKHLRNFARKPNEGLTAVPIAAVIHDAVEILSSRIKTLSAEVSIALYDEHLHVRAGRNRLQQVLVNLLGNALDIFEADPAVPRRIEITASGHDPVSIIVRDHGSGIDDEAASHIFDPFFTTKGVGKGLGLGLSISYNIIKDFGGLLSVRNHPEGGAEFTIELKRLDQPAGVAAE